MGFLRLKPYISNVQWLSRIRIGVVPVPADLVPPAYTIGHVTGGFQIRFTYREGNTSSKGEETGFSNQTLSVTG
jgi:hypothetical protein